MTNGVILLMTILTMLSIEDDINRKREATIYPSAGIPFYGPESAYRKNHPALFYSRYRFRLPDFLRVVRLIKSYGKQILSGRKGCGSYYPAEVCLSAAFLECNPLHCKGGAETTNCHSCKGGADQPRLLSQPSLFGNWCPQVTPRGRRLYQPQVSNQERSTCNPPHATLR